MRPRNLLFLVLVLAGMVVWRPWQLPADGGLGAESSAGDTGGSIEGGGGSRGSGGSNGSNGTTTGDGGIPDGGQAGGSSAGSTLRQTRQVGSWLEVEVDNRGSGALEVSLVAPGGTTRGQASAGVESTVLLDVLAGSQPLAEVAAEVILRAADGSVADRLKIRVREPVDLGNAPLLALTPSAADELRARYQGDGRVNYVLRHQVLGPARDFLQAPLAVPEIGGAWSGASNDADGLRASQEHSALADMNFKLGLAFVLTNKPEYAEGVRDILLQYASLYPTYPLHDRTGAVEGRLLPDAARMMAQTLDEARCLLDHARAYDLIRGSGVVDAQQDERITESFLRPSAQLLRGHEKGIHNIQCWLDSAAFLAFVQARDPVAASACISGKYGLDELLSQGVGADGTWLEASFMYHFFAAEAVVPMVRGLQALNLPFDEASVQRMTEAPYALSGPDGTLPMINDGVQIGLGGTAMSQTSFYEQVAVMFDSEDVSRPLRRWGRGRDYLTAVYGGPIFAQNPPADPPPAVNLADLGVAMLRVGPTAYQSSVAVDYGPHGGDHGHPDKLGIHVWLGGRPAIGEASTNLYGTALYRDYYKRSLAHSTVVQNGSDQSPASGSLKLFEAASGTLESASSQAIPGAQLGRLCHLTPDGYLIDLFRVQGGGGQSLDYVLHHYGNQVSTAAPFVDSADAGYPGDSAYDSLRKVKILDTSDDVDLTFSDSSGAHTVRVSGAPGTRLILAEAPWFEAGSFAPVLIIRRSASTTHFGIAAVDGTTFPADFQLQWDLAAGSVHYQSAGRPEGLQLSFAP